MLSYKMSEKIDDYLSKMPPNIVRNQAKEELGAKRNRGDKP